MGNAIRQKICQVFAPSMRAPAYSASSIVVARNCRIQKMPNALARPGKMTPWRLSTQLSLLMSSYCGMIDSCAGTVIVSRTSRNSALRPRNRSFAKAKPARAHITAWAQPITRQ